MDRQDEFGSMARALATFQDAAIERARLAALATEGQEARIARAERIEHLIADFETASGATIQTMSQTAASLAQAAEGMTMNAQTTAQQTGLVAASTHQASESVRELSSVSDQLAASISEIRNGWPETLLKGLASTRNWSRSSVFNWPVFISGTRICA
jgi:methyl-accepting chemotaxis protein